MGGRAHLSRVWWNVLTILLGAVKAKINRVGIYLAASKANVTGPLKISKKLPNLEEVLKVVVAAIEKACQSGLSKTELEVFHSVFRYEPSIFQLFHDVPSHFHLCRS